MIKVIHNKDGAIIALNIIHISACSFKDGVIDIYLESDFSHSVSFEGSLDEYNELLEKWRKSINGE